jgi:SAM-dependent methyltransferase
MPPPIDLAAIGLLRDAQGIWTPASTAPSGPISYPADGNAQCAEIEDTSFWFAHRNRIILALVRRHAPPGPFLDIGGGNGFVAKALQSVGIETVLLEPGREGAAMAHARGVATVINARLDDSALPASCFASAGMFDVLEHIEDDAAALMEARRLLRPDGRLFLTVPAFGFLLSADDVGAGHHRRYTAAGLAALLGRCGFRPLVCGYAFLPLLPLVFALRTLPSRLGLLNPADPARNAREHRGGGPLVAAIAALLRAEERRIAAGACMPFGTSVVAAAAAA